MLSFKKTSMRLLPKLFRAPIFHPFSKKSLHFGQKARKDLLAGCDKAQSSAPEPVVAAVTTPEAAPEPEPPKPPPMVDLLNTPTPNKEGDHQGKATYVNEPGLYSTRMLEPEVSTICRNLGAEGDPSMSVLNALTLLP